MEMRRRVAIAHTAFNAHRRTIYQNRSLPLSKPIQLFGTLIISKLVYGSESWVFRDMKSKEYLHASVMRLYRRLLGSPFDAHTTDECVLSLGK